MQLNSGRDRAPNHGIPSGHGERITHYELAGFKPSKLKVQEGPEIVHHQMKAVHVGSSMHRGRGDKWETLAGDPDSHEILPLVSWPHCREVPCDQPAEEKSPSFFQELDSSLWGYKLKMNCKCTNCLTQECPRKAEAKAIPSMGRALPIVIHFVWEESGPERQRLRSQEQGSLRKKYMNELWK